MVEKRRADDLGKRKGFHRSALQFYRERRNFYQEELERKYRLKSVFGFGGRKGGQEIKWEAHRQALLDTLEFFGELFPGPVSGKSEGKPEWYTVGNEG